MAGILFMCGAGLLLSMMSGFARFFGEDGWPGASLSPPSPHDGATCPV